MDYEKFIEPSQPGFKLLSKSFAQLVLGPGQTFYVDSGQIVYNSKKLETHTYYLTRNYAFGEACDKPRRANYVKLINKGQAFEYVGIKAKQGNRILAVNPSILENPICTHEHSVLAFSPELKTHRTRKGQFTYSGTGLMLIEAPGTHIEKRLGQGEEIVVKKNLIFAHSSNVRISQDRILMPRNQIAAGPGVVFICTQREDTKLFNVLQFVGLLVVLILLNFIDLMIKER